MKPFQWRRMLLTAFGYTLLFYVLLFPWFMIAAFPNGAGLFCLAFIVAEIVPFICAFYWRKTDISVAWGFFLSLFLSNIGLCAFIMILTIRACSAPNGCPPGLS